MSLGEFVTPEMWTVTRVVVLVSFVILIAYIVIWLGHKLYWWIDRLQEKGEANRQLIRAKAGQQRELMNLELEQKKSLIRQIIEEDEDERGNTGTTPAERKG